MGFEPGDKLSIYSYNRFEWYVAYVAANMCNGVAVGVYHTCSPDEVEWVVGNSDSKVVFVGTNPMDGGDTSKMCSHRLQAAMGNLGKVEAVVSMQGMDAIDHDTAMTWVEFIVKGDSTPEAGLWIGSPVSSHQTQLHDLHFWNWKPQGRRPYMRTCTSR